MNKLKEFLIKIELQKINEIICGGKMNGSIIIINFENNISLKINSVWRLNDNARILVSWDEVDTSLNSNYFLQMQFLKGDFITSIKISKFYDIKIKFKSGKELFVLCDINKYYSTDYMELNWLICDKKQNICVGVTKYYEEKLFKYD